jgi:hypothetical protein
MGAFRTVDGAERLEAPIRDGTLHLEVAPRHVALSTRTHRVVVTDEYVAITDSSRKRVRQQVLRISGVLIAARDVPREDLGLWLELAPGEMRRIFGVAPRDLIADGGLDALRALDRLTARLRQALQPHARGIHRAHEIGRGHDKVLLADDEESLVLYARHLFGDRARRVCTVTADGTITLVRRRGDLRFQLHERFGVTVTGDQVRFIDPEGTDLGKVVLHWIFPEDRGEIARRLGDMIERQVSPSEADAHAHATDARVWRRRARLIGRMKFRGLRTGW